MNVGDTFWIVSLEKEWGGYIEHSEMNVTEEALMKECLATGWTALEAVVTGEVTLETRRKP